MDVVRSRSDLGDGPEAVRRSRTEVRRSLAGVVDGDELDTAVLLANELVTNAMLHAGGRVRLTVLTRPQVVRLEVEDRSPRPPSRRRALDRERTSGRGLHLVELLGRSWGVDPHDAGKTVWCEIEVPGLTG